jgi:hypothetical protein
LFDTQFGAVANLGAIACACSGQNTLTLTPITNTPVVSSYPDLQPSFAFVASQTSNGSVTANINLVGARNCYKWNGNLQCGSGDLIAGNVYRLTPLAALNSGLGGFVCDSIGVNNQATAIEMIIDGGGSAIVGGVKGYLQIRPAVNIVNWQVMADQSGSIVVDILGATAAIPTTSIVGSGNKPTLSTSQYSGVVTPSGWTQTLLAAGTWLGFNVTSATTVTRVSVVLALDRQ